MATVFPDSRTDREHKKFRAGQGGTAVAVVNDGIPNLPSTYNGETVNPVFRAQATAAAANKVYEIDFKDLSDGTTSVVDGTNQLAIFEVEVWKNDYSAPTSTNSDFMIYLRRENTADGGNPSTVAFSEACAIGGPARIKLQSLTWGVTNVAISFTDTATYQISAKGYYYTPV